MRYASVSEFRGKKYVNIREYYDADGDLKPGKKGWFVLYDCFQPDSLRVYHCCIGFYNVFEVESKNENVYCYL